MKYLFPLFFFVVLFLNVSAQNKNLPEFIKTGDVFGTRAFVENKGQFDGLIDTDEKILYAYQNGEEQIYFTATGLIYKFIKGRKLSEKEIEELVEDKKGKPYKPKASFVYVNWENSNAEVQLNSSEKQSWYHSYGAATLNAYGYKKLIYRNVYNGIDIEYTIPDNKEHGIKYTVILHPGAKPGDIQIVYSGDLKKIKRVGEDIVITTAVQSITEHAPLSFNKKGAVISSHFILDNGKIGFGFPEEINSEEDLYIDPWVTTLPSLTNNNMGFDVDFDNAGNLYVYGGGSPNMVAGCKIAKYSPAGVLIWTFQMTLPPVSWNTIGLNGIPGNFTVNKTTQKVYTAETFGGKIVRLDVNGNYDNFITPMTFGWDEIWELGYDPCTGQVYAYGGGTSHNKNSAKVDEVNSVATPTNLSGFTQTNQDVICQTIDDNGNIFLAFTVPSTNTNVTTNYLLRPNAAFNGNTWLQLTTYNSFIEYSNKPFFTGVPPSVLAPSSNGFNCLAVNNNFLFYYDGFNVAAYNKNSGVLVASLTIPGYTALYQGGIAVDNCNNVYVGGNGVIHVFQFNGTTFATLPTIPLGITPVPRVYDIRLDKATNILYVSGNKFAGTYNASQVCASTDQLLVTYTCTPSGNALATASVTTSIANPLVSYSWTGVSGIVSQTSNSSLLQNTVAALPNGNYTVSIQINAPCGPLYTQTVIINCPLCSISASGTVACITSGYGFTLSAGNSANFSGPIQYLWTGPAAYSSTNAASIFNNGVFGSYTLTATDGSCIANTTVPMNSPPTANLSITSSATSACVGSSVILNSTATGGIAPYTYLWSGGSTSPVLTVSENQVGVYGYSLTVTDAANCKAKSTFTFSFNGLPVIKTNDVTICEGAVASLAATGADTYIWQPGSVAGNPLTISPKSTTSFTVTGTSKGCSANTKAMVIVLPVPALTFSASQNEGCVPLCVDLSAAVPEKNASLTWLIEGNTIAGNTISNYCFKTAGSYVAMLQAVFANGCAANSAATQINVFPKPTASFMYSGDLKMPVAQVQFMNMSKENIASYYWDFGDGSESELKDPDHVFPEAAVFKTFLVVEDIHGCKDTTSKTINIEELPALFVPNSFTPNGDGINDVFCAKGVGVRDFNMRIYSRWGQKLFETNDIFASWDGTYKGTTVKEDTYTWQVIYTLVGHRTETLTGHINVVR